MARNTDCLAAYPAPRRQRGTANRGRMRNITDGMSSGSRSSTVSTPAAAAARSASSAPITNPGSSTVTTPSGFDAIFSSPIAQIRSNYRAPPPPRPRRIVLVRHGQSEGNVDEGAYTRVPDPLIGLTPKGWRDAEGCGRRLRRLVESPRREAAAAADGRDDDDWKVYFYVSPYRRTLETLRGIGRAFEAPRIAGIREEPRLREQDFGNFQDREKVRVEKEARRRYGRFFCRFPDGESAAAVYVG